MSGRRPVVAVTGANGFVGGHLVPELDRGGFDVRRVVRRAELGDVVVPSIGPETEWEGALAGVDTVIHLAALAHRKVEGEAGGFYRSINTDGAIRLGRCAARAGVRQLIFLSTVFVHGRITDGRAPFREQDILHPCGLYGMSKAEAEAGLEAVALEGRMKVSVIRPPLIYGARAKANFALLARAAKLGLALPLASIRNRRAFLAVQNLSSFILFLLEHPDVTPRFESFLVADVEQVSTPELFTRLAAAAGRKAHLFGLNVDFLGRLVRSIGSEQVRDALIGSLEIDLSKLMSTGWRSRVTLDEGLRLVFSP